MRREEEQARVVHRAEEHEDVVVPAVRGEAGVRLLELAPVHERGLVAVVPVGDEDALPRHEIA